MATATFPERRDERFESAAFVGRCSVVRQAFLRTGRRTAQAKGSLLLISEPALHKQGDSYAERYVPCTPHNACGDLLVLEGSDPSGPVRQVSVMSKEGRRGESEDHRHEDI